MAFSSLSLASPRMPSHGVTSFAYSARRSQTARSQNQGRPESTGYGRVYEPCRERLPPPMQPVMESGAGVTPRPLDTRSDFC